MSTTAAPKPKRKKNRLLPQIAADQIIAYIKENQLQPGDKLPTEFKLAELLQVGRGTVREAIGSLISRNVLEVRQGSGTFVSSKSGIAEDPLGLALEEEDTALALDMIDVRLMLEPEIAFLAAMNASAEQVEALQAQCDLVERLIRQGLPYTQEDAMFHQMLGECCQNVVIRKLVGVITSSVDLNIDVTKDRYKMKTITYHRKITEAVRRQDPYGAKYHMTTHLNVVRTGIMEEMESNPEYALQDTTEELAGAVPSPSTPPPRK